MSKLNLFSEIFPEVSQNTVDYNAAGTSLPG